MGDEKFAPLLEELNRRQVVVHVHPAEPDWSLDLVPGVEAASVWYGVETTVLIVNLLSAGVPAKYPNIRWIFSHGGGALPMVVGRLAGFLSVRKDLAAKVPNGVLPELRKLYYDVVGVANPIAFGAVRELAGIPQLLFGTDYPFFPPDPTVKGLTDLPLSADERRAIERDNAVRLLPRLQK
jgi:predicted TIM-barrel fold metal-dependent hydrolase